MSDFFSEELEINSADLTLSGSENAFTSTSYGLNLGGRSTNLTVPLEIDSSLDQSFTNLDSSFFYESNSLFKGFSNQVLLQSVSTKLHERAPSNTDSLTGAQDGEVIFHNLSNTYTSTETVSGSLNYSDDDNPTRRNTYKDDYLLTSSTSSTIQINLDSTSFDPYLQLVDARTGQLLAFDNDRGRGTDAQLSFIAQAGRQYLIRATSYWSYDTGGYRLSANIGTSSGPTQPNLPTGFSSTYGYGLVDAAGAVAEAIDRSRFNDVADIGGNHWGLDMVNAPEAWAKGYRGQGVVVAVVDTGVDYKHSDLNGNIWRNTGEISGNKIDDDRNGYIDDVRGWDFVSNDNIPLDGSSHGTHVAGSIAAERNRSGITGVAYKSKIMPVRVLGTNGSGSDTRIATGIRYAVKNGADVINLSLGGNSPTRAIESALRYASDRNVFVVMAAGNDGDHQPDFPARYATQYGLSVGAVDRNGRIAYFSNRAGSNHALKHVVAPGVSIYSTVPRHRYAVKSGTSMATPHLAGVVALMLSANPNLTHDQLRAILTGNPAVSGRTTESTSSSSQISQAELLSDAIDFSEMSFMQTQRETSFNFESPVALPELNDHAWISSPTEGGPSLSEVPQLKGESRARDLLFSTTDDLQFRLLETVSEELLIPVLV